MMDNFEIRRIGDSLERIARAMESCESFTRWYANTMEKMGVTEQKTIDFIRQAIDDAIEERDANHRSYYNVLIENETLKKEICSLNEQLESAYADISERISDEEDD